MNEDLNNAFSVLVQKVTSGIDFAIEQAPDVIQQLITFKTFEYLFYCLLGVALICISIKLAFYLKNKTTKYNDYCDSREFFLLMISSAIFLLVGFSLFVTELINLIKITLAPKLWLIEYAATLVK